MTALGDARVEVKNALTPTLNGLGVPVFDQPPGSIQPPCVVIVPGRPWIAPRGAVNLEIVAYSNPAAGNTHALTDLEGMVEAVRDGLWVHGLAPGDTDPPEVNPDAGLISARTPVTLRTACH